MSIDGITIVRSVYRNLRNPSDTALPYKTALEKVASVIKKKKLDLALSEQNTLVKFSDWFRPNSPDFALSEFAPNVFLPVKVERREQGSSYSNGVDVPLVNYQVLNDSHYGSASFYGTPPRMAFRHTADYEYTGAFEYRIAYEPDFSDAVGIDEDVRLPEYFSDMISTEAAYTLAPLVEDNSDEWLAFLKMRIPMMREEIADERERWNRYVKSFKGRASVQKRTFFDNRRPSFRRIITR